MESVEYKFCVTSVINSLKSGIVEEIRMIEKVSEIYQVLIEEKL